MHNICFVLYVIIHIHISDNLFLFFSENRKGTIDSVVSNIKPKTREVVP